MRKSFFSSLTLILALSLMVGCMKQRVEKLTDRTEAYNRSLRWSSLTAAGAHLGEENRRTLLLRLTKDLGQNRIVDFSILDLGIDERKETASVLVEFSYFPVAYQDLRYRQEIQTWKYIGEKSNWFVTDFRPVPLK